MRRRHRAGAAVALALASALLLAAHSGPAPDRSLCYDCFWTLQPASLKKEITSVYRGYACADDFCRGEVAFLLGNVTGDDALLRKSVASYRRALQLEKDEGRKLLLNMILGMAGGQGEVEEKPFLGAAADLARARNRPATATLFEAMRDGTARPLFGDAPIRTNLTMPAGTREIVLGESVIRVRRGETVAVQMERTYRDWLSHQLRFDFKPASLGMDRVLDYHEGARLRDLIRLASVKPIAVTGTLLATKGGKWYAPDEKGVFRFEVLEDKVLYATTKRRGDLALMTDTHGVSSLVDQSVAAGAGLVIGCGDNPGKAQAAYHLAARGIDVYMPCDRSISLLLGHDAPGVILGTAPVHEVNGETVIGGQPVRFRVGETIVVTDVERDSVARYYDAPARYFRALAAVIPLDVRAVMVSEPKQTAKAVNEAKRAGATAIGVRVRHEEDYQAVRAWLSASESNRAVLFHSAPYPPGNRLFGEFPKQVTFGDPRPRFVQ